MIFLSKKTKISFLDEVQEIFEACVKRTRGKQIQNYTQLPILHAYHYYYYIATTTNTSKYVLLLPIRLYLSWYIPRLELSESVSQRRYFISFTFTTVASTIVTKQRIEWIERIIESWHSAVPLAAQNHAWCRPDWLFILKFKNLQRMIDRWYGCMRSILK